MNIDLPELVKAALRFMGCDHAIGDDLDAHSPICISLNAVPDILIETRDQYCLLWSEMRDIGEEAVLAVSADLFAYLLPLNSALFVERRPVLSILEGRLILHAALTATALQNEEAFAEALENFYADLCAVVDILAK
ncbi:InvB/SpaK family type III secretion system chaperone [Chitinasiproducens palmae]|uniref:Invasion protein B family protein n=1 Tax=Chitinasiproducens palmae TaxID=1770053 RepID=A0A1H2PJ14_9BURK|nr:hypothetical protein [Chitinasiproducens palmae]SDV46274.1 Invasion protein B family protein [Chitinasiproducens palmae]